MPPPTAAEKLKTAAAEGQMELGILGEVLGFRLRRIQNHLSQGFRLALAGRELRPGEFSALALIAANPGISQKELAREGGFDKASIVGMLDDLERWGWAVRQRSTVDRRRHSLFITPAGDKVLAELFVVAKENEAKVGEVLSPRELESLYDMLDRIYARCFSDDTP